MSDKQIKRKRFSLVNKEMHYRYVGLMVLTVFVISAIMSAFIFLSSFDTINVLKQLSAGNAGLFASLEASQYSNLLRVLMALVLIIVAVAVVGVVEMSKIAGPLYRIAQTTRQLARRDYSMKFKLRTRDIPQDIGDSFTDLIDNLKSTAKNDSATLDDVSSKLKDISAKADKGTAETINEAISALDKISERNKNSIQVQE